MIHVTRSHDFMGRGNLPRRLSKTPRGERGEQRKKQAREETEVVEQARKC